MPAHRRGPSGYEAAPAAVFRDAAADFAEVTTDIMGSVWARVPGTVSGRTLAVVGHIDEIGLIVTHIDDKGFLFCIGVGGWDPPNLVGQRVDVLTKDGVVAGVIGKKPIHLLKPDQPGIEVKELGEHELGSGPVLERGSVLNPAIFEGLHATATEKEIAFTVSSSAGRTGTDADAVHFSRAGVPCGLIGLPLRYMHSPVEMVQIGDVQVAAELIAAYALGLAADASFSR